MYVRGRPSDTETVSIRLALVGLPRLLADLVGAAFAADDAHIDVLGDESEVRLHSTEAGPRHDAVIACVDDPWRGELTALLAARNELLVLGVHRDGRSSWIYEMRPCPRSLGALGPQQVRRVVLDALRVGA